jgi:cytochrome c biogenesis protein CcdA
MLDDMIVFFTAMATLKVVGGTAKYTRASNLIGGILMLALGLLLIFKPEWLMFG